MKLDERSRFGFMYLVEVIRNGIIVEQELVHNLMPTEGLNYVLGASFKGAAQVANWYLAPYEGNYTPVPTNTAANFPGLATECTAYDEATRVAFTSGAAAAGALDNAAARAEFTFNAIKTVYGGFLTSVAAKGAITGVVGSAVRFASPKQLDVGAVLRLTAGITLTSS